MTRYPLYRRLGGLQDGCGKFCPHRDSIPGLIYPGPLPQGERETVSIAQEVGLIVIGITGYIIRQNIGITGYIIGQNTQQLICVLTDLLSL
jgi:hypothetical protein